VKGFICESFQVKVRVKGEFNIQSVNLRFTKNRRACLEYSQTRVYLEIFFSDFSLKGNTMEWMTQNRHLSEIISHKDEYLKKFATYLILKVVTN
jgi:hypothetical protein